MAKTVASKARNSAISDRAARPTRKIAAPAVRPGYYRGEAYRPEDSVGYLMKQVVELLSRALDARMAEYSLTDAQWRPLLLLSRKDLANNASQVAKWVGCDAGATTRMLDRLEDKGLLRRVRSTDDRRVQQLELTDEGRKVAQIVPYVIADVLNGHLADLSRAEIEQLRSLLERVIAAGRREADMQMPRGVRE
jgi:DNA-binding MarR family transcriptional regulator